MGRSRSQPVKKSAKKGGAAPRALNRGLVLAIALVAIAAAGFALLTFDAGSPGPSDHALHPGHDHSDIDAASRERLQALLEEADGEGEAP